MKHTLTFFVKDLCVGGSVAAVHGSGVMDVLAFLLLLLNILQRHGSPSTRSRLEAIEPGTSKLVKHRVLTVRTLAVKVTPLGRLCI